MIFVYKTQNQTKMQGQVQMRNPVIGNKFKQMGWVVLGGGDRVVGGNTVSNYTILASFCSFKCQSSSFIKVLFCC